ncbi:deoxyguanosinetriphosphate triphosphohydrolase [Candidatus Sumerlaeota bacterium]|nr:deoxyguanosinetriphosphate triphosphohydrolase [Candidatus Sumerlaeota bacterium]
MHGKVLVKEDLEKLEAETLAPYAMLSSQSRGRQYPISPDEFRTEFQRDRDRIIHSTAFRKLEYKTQVFVIHEGDYFRTRLTHTMEVVQIAQSLARNLRLNVDLTEAIALAHDIGHTPFGHSGERALRRLMADEGGFEHNEQGLRVVELLEERYPDIPGLNLTWEVREGIIKHATEYDTPRIEERFEPHKAPTLEAQIVDLADEIAYNNHDLDDALKMGLIEEEDLKSVPWCWEIFQQARSSMKHSARDKFVKYRAISTVIHLQVTDALQQTQANIEKYNIRSVADVRNLGKKIAQFSPEMTEKNRQLKDFLMANVYRHPHTIKMVTKAEKFVERLFLSYLDVPEQLPRKYQERLKYESKKRVICDYISGMTDRYLLEEYIKTFEPQMLI